MNNPEQTYQAPKLNPDTLIIETSDDCLSYCEYNQEHNTPLSIQTQTIDKSNLINTESEFQRFINASKLLSKPQVNVLINHSNSKFTFCPTILYSPENARDLLEFNVGSIGDSIIKTDYINHDIICLYSIPDSTNSFIDKVLPNHKSRHTLSVLSELFLTSEEFKNETILLAVSQSFIYLLVKQKQKLVLANAFTISSQEDILYYLLFSLEQYELNPLTARLSIVGDTETNSSLSLAIKKYIKEVRFACGNKAINWSNLKGISQHHYFSILNRIFCAS